MISGKIKTWIDDRGFGFIRRDDGGDDVFVHCRDIRHLGVAHLPPDLAVEFRLATDPQHGGKSHAVDVRYA